MVARSADNGREDSTRRIITGETGLAHTGAIVNDESCNLFFHGGDVCEGVIEKKVGWCIGRLR